MCISSLIWPQIRYNLGNQPSYYLPRCLILLQLLSHEQPMYLKSNSLYSMNILQKGGSPIMAGVKKWTPVSYSHPQIYRYRRLVKISHGQQSLAQNVNP